MQKHLIQNYTWHEHHRTGSRQKVVVAGTASLAATRTTASHGAACSAATPNAATSLAVASTAAASNAAISIAAAPGVPPIYFQATFKRLSTNTMFSSDQTSPELGTPFPLESNVPSPSTQLHSRG